MGQPQDKVNYSNLIELAKMYQDNKQLYDIYFSLGEFQRDENLLKESNESFKLAISYAEQLKLDTKKAYEYIARNLADMGNYEGAILSYMTLRNQSDRESEEYYSISYRVAALEGTAGNYDNAIKIVNELLKDCKFEQIRISSSLIEVSALRESGRSPEAIELGLRHEKNPGYKDYLFFVYRHLSLAYQEIKDYDSAIKYMIKSTDHTAKTLFYKEHGRVALADIYIDAKQFENAKNELDLIKPLLVKEQDYTLAEKTYTAYLKICEQERDVNQLKEFIEELKILIENDRISENIYYKLKTKGLQCLLETQLN